MSAGLTSAWEEIRSSLYFIPGILVLFATVLASTLLAIDGTFPDLETDLPWVFGGSASAGRSLLSTIATSLITVVSIAFSVTMVALQQASTNFTPRVLRTFTRDKSNQIVLGVYIGTFAYALLVMRQIRESDDGRDSFVPALSISGAILLALLAMGLLVYFIHHTSRSLEVSWILDSITEEVEEKLDEIFPEPLGRDAPEPPLAATLSAELCPPGRTANVLLASESGYLRRIDFQQLQDATPSSATVVRVHPAMGAYVLRGEPLLTLYPAQPLDDAHERRLLAALAFGAERSIEQDELFGVRQMVDIAVKAMSPGVNDPTTAEQTLDRLGSVLARLVHREYPSPLREADGKMFLFNRAGFGDHVEAAFSQIRRASASDVHVTIYFIGLVSRLGAQAPSSARRRVLAGQIEAVLDALPSSELGPLDRALIEEEANKAIRQLDTAANEQR